MVTRRLILSKADNERHRLKRIKKKVNKANKRNYVKNKF